MLYYYLFGIPYTSETRKSETDSQIYEVFEIQMDGIDSDIVIPPYFAKTLKEGNSRIIGWLHILGYEQAIARLPKGNPQLGSNLDKRIRELAYDYQQSLHLYGDETIEPKYKRYLKNRNLAYYALAVALTDPERPQHWEIGNRPTVNELVQNLFQNTK